MLLRGFTGPELTTQTRHLAFRKNGVLQSTADLPLVTGFTESKCLGVDVDNFHRKRRQGLMLPFTSYYKGQIETVAPLTGTYSASKVISGVTNTYTSSDWSLNSAQAGSSGSLLSVEDVWRTISNEFDIGGLVQKAAAAIYSQGWDTLTFIGELKDTIRMFASLLERFLQVLRRQPRKGSPWNAWLQWRYGLRTLLMDIETFVKVTTSFDETKERYRKKTTGESFKTTYQTNTSDDGRLRTVQTFRTELTINVVGRVIAEITPPRFACNPLVTGWELVNLSFVVDWFVGVGQALAALSFLYLQHHHYSGVGALLTVNTTTQLAVTGINGWTGTQTQPSWRSLATYRVREPIPVPLLPRVWVKLNVEKVLDLLALLAQFLVGQRKIRNPRLRYQ